MSDLWAYLAIYMLLIIGAFMFGYRTGEDRGRIDQQLRGMREQRERERARRNEEGARSNH